MIANEANAPAAVVSRAIRICPGAPRWAGRVARVNGAGVALLGVVVLLGWLLDNREIKRGLPGLADMKANTALGFVVAGAALWATASAGCKLRHSVRTAGALLIMALGLATSLEYAAEVNLGIDELLFLDPRGSLAWGLPPGRMALASAFAFVMVGCSLLLLRGRATVLAQLLACATVLTALFSLAGYLCREVAITGGSPYTSLALHTAAGFTALAFGLLAAAPPRGPVAVLMSDTRSGTLARLLLPAALGVTLGLGGLGAAGQRAGWYGPVYGIVLFALTTATLLVGVIWYITHLALASEEAARESGDQVRRLNEALERRVAERTAALEAATTALRQEIDERQRVEEKRQREGDRYRSLVLASAQIVWTTTPEGRVTEDSPSWSAFTGQAYHEWKEWGWLDAVHTEDRAGAAAAWAEAVARRGLYKTEYRLRGRRRVPPHAGARRAGGRGGPKHSRVGGHLHRHHRTARGGGAVARGQGGGGGGQPGQERVPGEHEPRDPHAHERHPRHDGADPRLRR